jgi:hypothetical protein
MAEFEPFDHHEPDDGPPENPTLFEIADRLQHLGYPTQAGYIRSGEPSQLLTVADWLDTEAGYVKRGASELRGYALSLRQAASFEARLG